MEWYPGVLGMLPVNLKVLSLSQKLSRKVKKVK